MSMNEHFREALERLDIPLARKMWAHVMPHMPQPPTDGEALIIMHVARTHSEAISFRARAYSHSWLIERGIPSKLPDELRPRAERMYPQPIAAVGIAVQNRTPVALAIRGSMEDAVRDAGVSNPQLTKRAMMSARERIRRQLGV